jgi:hypothetical protein
MRRFDNATPRGLFIGDRPAQTVGWIAACCRDGFARMCLVRPLQWVRPDGPTGRDISDESTRLCSPCRQKRLSCGAQDLDCYR